MSHSDKIPKIIHYCWFGKSEMPELSKKCIESWRKYLPDYEIREWNEENFDINMNKYVKEAYEAKKYAFVSDFARYHILYKHGGIYMDTDVEVIKSLDPLLTHTGFAGFEKYIGDNGDLCYGINPGLIIASKRNNRLIENSLKVYENKSFIKLDGSMDTTTVVKYASKVFKEHGFSMNGDHQEIDGFNIYPTDYFCPLNHINGELKINSNTYTIHHYVGSWLSNKSKIKNRIRVLIIKTIGANNFYKLKKVVKR